MNIGLYFGTFNPVHNGHINIAKYIISNTDIDKIVFVLTPQNPIKSKCYVEASIRLKMLNLALEDLDRMSVSNIELNMEGTNYTYKTISKLKDIYKGDKLILIIGEDNFASFTKWKNYEYILSECQIYVYPRNVGNNKYTLKRKNIMHLDSCLYNISSTQIREKIANKTIYKNLLPIKVFKFIKINGIYS